MQKLSRSIVGWVVLALVLTTGFLVSDPVDAAARPAKPVKPVKTEKAVASAPIDINNADEQELETIPGIGKATAARIVQFREEHGPYRRVEDLMKVKGIGEKSFEKLRAYVKVGRTR